MGSFKIGFGSVMYLAFICSAAVAQEFYSNGVALNRWDRYPNREFIDNNGTRHVGYFQTSHFIKGAPSDPFWVQRIAVKTFDVPNFTWYFDQTTRVWVGRWDDNAGMYAKLDKRFRRHRVSDIPVGALPDANIIPRLAELVPGFNGPISPDSALMSDPPDTSDSRDVSDDSKNIDETVGPPPVRKRCCSCCCRCPYRSRRIVWRCR